MKVYLPQIIGDAERKLFEKKAADPLDLMQKAAREMFLAIKDRLRPFDAIAVLCGKGNNAGDGYELARLLLRSGFNVLCISVFAEPPATEPAHTCFDAYIAAGGKIECDPKAALGVIAMCDILIDAVFGIGFRGVIEKDSALYRYIDAANAARAYRVALDVPSGVRSDDGSIGGAAFFADLTVTVTAVKIGMMSYPAKVFCGQIEVADIGIDTALLDTYKNPGFVPDDRYVKKGLPARPILSNKGDFGKLLCLCGSENMTGAAVLSVEAALRAGTGLVTLAAEKSVLDCVRFRLAEPIYLPLDWEDESSVKQMLSKASLYSAVLVGCGLGRSEKKAETLATLIRAAHTQLIFDADGINLLAEHIHVLKEAHKPPILTPHPGEFARISGYDVDYINDNRIRVACEYAEKYRCITVLKGAGTITASPDGRFAVNASGNAGLAKGGSGDVLAGLIAGLAANPHIDAFDAAVCGVYLHGRAADVLKGKSSEYGLLPSELSSEFAKMLP